MLVSRFHIHVYMVHASIIAGTIADTRKPRTNGSLRINTMSPT